MVDPCFIRESVGEYFSFFNLHLRLFVLFLVQEDGLNKVGRLKFDIRYKLSKSVKNVFTFTYLYPKAHDSKTV